MRTTSKDISGRGILSPLTSHLLPLKVELAKLELFTFDIWNTRFTYIFFDIHAAN